MPFRVAESLDGPMGKGKIDLRGRRAHVVRGHPQPTEQALGDPVMSAVLEEGLPALRRQSALPPVAHDEVELLEGRKMGERRRGGDPQGSGDGIQGGGAAGPFEFQDGLERLDLPAGEPAENFHGGSIFYPIFMAYSKY